MTWLEDGHCSLSDNLSENAIRTFTGGLRNRLRQKRRGAASIRKEYHGIQQYSWLL